MACMEHECTECKWVAMDNQTWAGCPKCGAEVRSYFDEAGDRDYLYDDDRGLEDRDIDEGGEG